ncbi:hypothetical protein [Gordonia sihwensis]|uniref:hypothetical protein n=1 Tax=Gordonia sihwensis TaxID=173559 RepID=UPI00069685CD|nr:hypothetical protein [Gordonia sihwensis]
MTRKFTKTGVMLAVIGLIAAAMATFVGTGTAGAKYRETPRIGVAGDEVWTVGDNGRCRGTVGISVKNDPAKRGWVEVTLRSRGFTSNTCKATIKMNYWNTVPAFYHEKFMRITGTRNRGPILAQKKFHIGSGLNLIGFSSMNPAQKGASFYIAIP